MPASDSTRALRRNSSTTAGSFTRLDSRRGRPDQTLHHRDRICQVTAQEAIAAGVIGQPGGRSEGHARTTGETQRLLTMADAASEGESRMSSGTCCGRYSGSNIHRTGAGCSAHCGGEKYPGRSSRSGASPSASGSSSGHVPSERWNARRKAVSSSVSGSSNATSSANGTNPRSMRPIVRVVLPRPEPPKKDEAVAPGRQTQRRRVKMKEVSAILERRSHDAPLELSERDHEVVSHIEDLATGSDLPFARGSLRQVEARPYGPDGAIDWTEATKDGANHHPWRTCRRADVHLKSKQVERIASDVLIARPVCGVILLHAVFRHVRRCSARSPDPPMLQTTDRRTRQPARSCRCGAACRRAPARRGRHRPPRETGR